MSGDVYFNIRRRDERVEGGCNVEEDARKAWAAQQKQRQQRRGTKGK
jgi:hypothetical protein